MNFTKNYMLLYLFFTFKAKTITLEYLDGTQREREPPPRLILHAGVSVIQCCRDFPRAAIQTPFVDYCFTKQWTKSGLILNERKHFLPTEELTSLRPSSWILGEVGVGSKGDERDGRRGIVNVSTHQSKSLDPHCSRPTKPDYCFLLQGLPLPRSS